MRLRRRDTDLIYNICIGLYERVGILRIYSEGVASCGDPWEKAHSAVFYLTKDVFKAETGRDLFRGEIWETCKNHIERRWPDIQVEIIDRGHCLKITLDPPIVKANVFNDLTKLTTANNEDIRTLIDEGDLRANECPWDRAER